MSDLKEKGTDLGLSGAENLIERVLGACIGDSLIVCLLWVYV